MGQDICTCQDNARRWLSFLPPQVWFVWTSAPVRLTTEERWPHDAEDLSQCLFQQQTLQRKEEEEIPKCLTMYEKCLHGSIHLLHQSNHPSIHACMHACIQLAKRKQTDSQMYAPRATLIDVNCLNCNFYPMNSAMAHGSGSTRDQSLAQFQDSFLCNFAKYE